MLKAKPDEIMALAEALGAAHVKLGDLNADLAGLKRKLESIWPDAKGDEVRAEIQKIEDLNELAGETIRSQFNLLLQACEEFDELARVDVSGGV